MEADSFYWISDTDLMILHPAPTPYYVLAQHGIKWQGDVITQHFVRWGLSNSIPPPRSQR